MYKRILLLASFLLLIGAGCASDAPPATLPAGPSIPEPEQEVVKRPRSVPPLTQAFEFCKTQGYNISMAYNAVIEKPVISCLFSDNSQCEAVAFYENRCSPNKGAAILADNADSSLSELRQCSVFDPPVCGTDGNNYTNRCAAIQQNVEVKHDGLCTPEEQGNPILSGSDDSGSDVFALDEKKSTSPEQINTDTGEAAVWLGILFDIVKSQKPSSPRALVDKCSIQANTFYYFEEGGINGFSTLYNESGSIQCFPSNRINEPSSFCQRFNPADRGHHCRRIWTDSR